MNVEEKREEMKGGNLQFASFTVLHNHRPEHIEFVSLEGKKYDVQKEGGGNICNDISEI